MDKRMDYYEEKICQRKGQRRRARRRNVCLAVVTAGAGVFLLFAAIGLVGHFNSRVAKAADSEPGTAADKAVIQIHSETDAPLVFQTIEKSPEDTVIVLDPGHGGTDEGCFYENVLEKNINLSIALAVKRHLAEMGYQVVMTREADIYLAKEDRVRLANETGAAAFISIHQNTYEDSGPEGLEVWYDGTDTDRDSERLAKLVLKKASENSGGQERELRDNAGFFVTGQTAMPACLIETGFLSNSEERKKLVSEEYQDQIAAGIASGIDLYFRPRTMYLTFDDGPSAEDTNAILDILKARNIKATFFVVGENVRNHPETARRIVEEGHTIGIHCNRHVYEEIYESVETYLADFEEAYQAVYEVTGVKAKLFRFPGGSINSYNQAVGQDIIREMTDRGFVYFDWNASLEDALKKAEPEELVANAKDTALNRKKVVMLAHDIVHSTALCLEELIDQFPEYRMEALTPEVKPIQFH